MLVINFFSLKTVFKIVKTQENSNKPFQPNLKYV